MILNKPDTFNKCPFFPLMASYMAQRSQKSGPFFQINSLLFFQINSLKSIKQNNIFEILFLPKFYNGMHSKLDVHFFQWWHEIWKVTKTFIRTILAWYEPAYLQWNKNFHSFSCLPRYDLKINLIYTINVHFSWW